MKGRGRFNDRAPCLVQLRTYTTLVPSRGSTEWLHSRVMSMVLLPSLTSKESPLVPAL